jgi:hypothetical protein
MPTATTAPELMNRRQAARHLGIAPATLARWHHEGRGPRPLRLTAGPRGRVVYRRCDLEAFVAGLADAPMLRFDPPPGRNR